MSLKNRCQFILLIGAFLTSFVSFAGEQMSSDEKLQLLLDEREITNLMLTFANSLDTGDWQAYGETFIEDGTFTILGQTRKGREAIMAGPARDLTKYDNLQHFSTNQRIQVNGDEATASSYFLAVHVPSAEQLDVHADVGGRYDYQLVRTEAGWRFADVKISVKWTGGTKFKLGDKK